MNKKYLLFIILLFVSYLKAFEVGIIKSPREIDEDYIRIAKDVVSSHFKNANFNVNMQIYNSKEGLKLFKESKFDWAAAPASLFFDNEKMFKDNMKNLWLVPINSQKFHQFYFVTNKKNKNVFSNLQKYKVYLPEVYEGTHFYYKSLLYKRFKKNAKKYFSKIEVKNKESKILYDIFFKEDIIGIIPKASYDIIVELNPQIKKKVKIINKSKSFYIPFLVFSHKRMTNNEEKEMLDFLKNKKNVVFDNSRLIPGSLVEPLMKISLEEIEELRKLYFEYKALEKKYKR